jgi:CHAT domain-containing protein
MRTILIVVLLFASVLARAQSFVEINKGIETDIVTAIKASREDGVRYKTFFGLLELGSLYLDKNQLWKCDSVLNVMETEFADLIRSGKAHWQGLDVASYYQLLSSYYLLKSDNQKAKLFLREAQRINRNVYSLSNNLFPLFVREGKLDSAELFLQSAFPRIARDLDIDKLDEVLVNDFSTAFRNMCELKILQGDLKGFEYYLFKWLNISKGTLSAKWRIKRKYNMFTHWQLVYLTRYFIMTSNVSGARTSLRHLNVAWLSPELQVEKLRTEAQLHFFNNNPDSTIIALKAVLSVHKESVKQYFPQFTEVERESYISKLNDDYDFFMTAVTAKGEPDQNHLLDLFEFQLFRKGLLLDVTRKLNKAGANLETPEGRALSQRISAVNDSIALYTFKNKPPKTGESKEAFLARLTRQKQQYEKALLLLVSKNVGDLITDQNAYQIAEALPERSCLVEIIRFQKRMKDNKKLLIPGKNSYVVIVMDKDSKLAYRLLEDGDELESRYAKLYKNVMTSQLSDERLYQKFWGEIAPLVKPYQVVFLSPDGIYNVLNVNTLQNPVTKQYVLDETQIVNVTSPKDLLGTFDRTSVNKSAMLIGYPLYSYNAPAAATALTVRGSILHDLEKIKTNEFTLLPGTRDEIHSIDDLIQRKAGKSIILEGESANEQQLKAARIPDILHIATHGFFISSTNQMSNPLLQSGLVLAGVSNKGVEDQTGQDGILTALEISALDLTGTKLVVLSACETGLGEIKNGDGVYGLQRAFRLAEAKYVILSLWKVDDTATMKLMELFYSRLMDTNDVVLSFNTAQKELRKLYPEPYYWGAFRLIGY